MSSRDPNTPTPLDFLEAVYLNEGLPLTTRLRAAIEAAPYRHSKQPARVQVETSFASRLEQALARSDRARLIEGVVVQVVEEDAGSD